MLNHLRFKHPTEIKSNSDCSASTSQPSIKNFLRENKPCDSTKAAKITDYIVRFFYKDLLPVKFVDSPNFKELLKFMEPNYQIPSRTNIVSKIDKLYISQKEALKTKLTSEQCAKISITTDCWTSLNADSFITVTAHFITKPKGKWMMENAVLATRFVEVTHTAENLRKIVEDILIEFEIHGKTIACVHDNAANIKLAIRELESIRFSVCCSAHTLQLSVNLGLKTGKIQKVISKSSKLVAHFKHSAKATNALREKQHQQGLPQHKLVQSVITRWNSVGDMFDRLLEQRWAITAVLCDKRVTKMSDARVLELKDEEWLVVEQMSSCLKPLKKATETLSMEKHVSISLVAPVMFTLVNRYLQIEETDSVLVNNFKTSVREDIRRRYPQLFIEDEGEDGEDREDEEVEVCLLLVASALDPRHKHLPFLSENRKTIVYDRNKIKDTERRAETEGVEELQPTKKAKSDDFLGDDYYSSSDSFVKDEVDYYLSITVGEGGETDPLMWWNSQQATFPKLSTLAEDYLGIPCSSVAAERMFSAAGRLLTKLRSSISNKHVDQLLFLNKNME